MKTKVSIEGMSCGHCVKHVNGALSEIDGVESVDVNLESKCAIFSSSKEINDEIIKLAIEDVGYEAVKIERL